MKQPSQIIVCHKYLQLNRKKYRWSEINSVRLAHLKWEEGGKCPVLLIEFLKPVKGGALHFKEPQKLAPMKPGNVQEYILDRFSKKKYPEIMDAISLYKKVEPTIEIEAYVE